MNNLILPKPEVTENTTVIQDSEQMALDVNHYIKRSGDAGAVPGYFYVGSACFHMYKSKIVADDYNFMCATPIGAASEGMCDIGWKRLRSALMRTFGRAEPKRRK